MGSEDTKEEQITVEEMVSIGYFSYSDKDMIELTLKEKEKIAKLEKQLDYNNPLIVYNLYLKIIEGGILKSPEGMLYLIHLQDFLDSKSDLLPHQVPTIPVEYLMKSFGSLENDQSSQDTIMKLKDKIRALESEQSKAYKNLKVKTKKTDNFIYKCVIAGMTIVIIAMIIISIMSDSPNIINYRNVIQNEYSEWEQKLNDKEKELNDKEKKLNNKEKISSQNEVKSEEN